MKMIHPNSCNYNLCRLVSNYTVCNDAKLDHAGKVCQHPCSNLGLIIHKFQPLPSIVFGYDNYFCSTCMLSIENCFNILLWFVLVSTQMQPHSWIEPQPLQKVIQPQSRTDFETIQPQHCQLWHFWNTKMDIMRWVLI